MMKILALETSTEYCSVAIFQSGDAKNSNAKNSQIISRSELVGQRHSEVLLGMIAQVMSEAGVKLSQLDGIAFGSGPGSFTGVRIACGVAQGLALGATLPVLGVCTLQAVAQVAYQIEGRNKIIAALDARMNEVYFACYELPAGEWQAGAWKTAVEPALCLPENTPEVIGSGWFGAGGGFLAHGVAWSARYGNQLAGVDATIIPEASAIAQLAAPLFATGQGMDAALALPLYLRDKVALKIAEQSGGAG